MSRRPRWARTALANPSGPSRSNTSRKPTGGSPGRGGGKCQGSIQRINLKEPPPSQLSAPAPSAGASNQTLTPLLLQSLCDGRDQLSESGMSSAVDLLDTPPTGSGKMDFCPPAVPCMTTAFYLKIISSYVWVKHEDHAHHAAGDAVLQRLVKG